MNTLININNNELTRTNDITNKIYRVNKQLLLYKTRHNLSINYSLYLIAHNLNPCDNQNMFKFDKWIDDLQYEFAHIKEIQKVMVQLIIDEFNEYIVNKIAESL